VVPEEQDIHAHHDGDQSKHVKRDGRVSFHRFILGVGGPAEGPRCAVPGGREPPCASVAEMHYDNLPSMRRCAGKEFT